MKQNRLRLFGIFGILGSILMIAAAFLEERFPKPLWIVISVCMLLNVVSIWNGYRLAQEKKKGSPGEETDENCEEE